MRTSLGHENRRHQAEETTDKALHILPKIAVYKAHDLFQGTTLFACDYHLYGGNYN